MEQSQEPLGATAAKMFISSGRQDDDHELEVYDKTETHLNTRHHDHVNRRWVSGAESDVLTRLVSSLHVNLETPWFRTPMGPLIGDGKGRYKVHVTGNSGRRPALNDISTCLHQNFDVVVGTGKVLR